MTENSKHNFMIQGMIMGHVSRQALLIERWCKNNPWNSYSVWEESEEYAAVQRINKRIEKLEKEYRWKYVSSNTNPEVDWLVVTAGIGLTLTTLRVKRDGILLVIGKKVMTNTTVGMYSW